MEILSYVYEVFFLGLGIYLLLFSLGRLRSKDVEKQKRIEEFRTKMNPWMGIFGVALIVLYGATLIVHLMGK